MVVARVGIAHARKLTRFYRAIKTSRAAPKFAIERGAFLAVVSGIKTCETGGARA
jgi:hypothetical protein